MPAERGPSGTGHDTAEPRVTEAAPALTKGQRVEIVGAADYNGLHGVVAWTEPERIGVWLDSQQMATTDLPVTFLVSEVVPEPPVAVPGPASETPAEPPNYPVEWVECDRCHGDGEYEDDLWIVVGCYGCAGTGFVEVCAECGDNGEECDLCGR